MAGLDLDRRSDITTRAAQQRPSGWKTELVEPQPGLPCARDGPGRGIHHHQPQTGHRLHQVSARLDDRRLPGMLEEPLPRCRRLPSESPAKRWTNADRSARPPSMSNITTRSLPLTCPTLAT
ncbi:hypothetical protein Pd630_LPD12016 (plasmid) [Rhodococcus opacus PD630]|nr:hypothetical protein Pd630_LPD12016 [Rhodococcus opacus PD630]